MGSTIDWIAFQRVFGYGTVRAQRVLEACEHPTQLLEMASASLEKLPLFKRERELLRNVGVLRQEAEATMEKAYKLGCIILTPESSDYPERLADIYGSPSVLYVLGSLDGLSDQLTIGMVGTRQVTEYGRRAARELSAGLAKSGVAVISGMAAGVDAEAHWAALKAGGRTIAVLGNGLDTIYPSSNKELHSAILASGGAVVSEFPPGEQPLPFHFPIRNRIISGLSMGVVVVEGTRHSGSLITAGHALTQNREVFAVPGGIYSPMSGATNWLISQGATLVTCVDDILAQFPYLLEQQTGKEPEPSDQLSLELPEEPKPVQPPPSYLSGNQLTIWNKLEEQPLSSDNLAVATGLPVQTVLSALTQLELFGLVQACPGRNFKKI